MENLNSFRHKMILCVKKYTFIIKINIKNIIYIAFYLFPNWSMHIKIIIVNIYVWLESRDN